MTLRSPVSILTRDTVAGLAHIKEQIAVLQDQISKGKRIVRLADDPAGSSLSVDLQAPINANKQYLKQVDDALDIQKSSQTVTQSMDDNLSRLQELGEEALNGTLGAANRQQLANEVDGIRSNLISFANTQSQGKYIFAGTKTQTLPFSGPSAGPITYAGDGNLIQVDVGPSASTTLNIPGNTLFFGAGGQGSATDIFQQVTDLRDALNTNNLAAIQTAVTNLKGIQDAVNIQTTVLGGRQSTVLQLKDNLEAFSLTLQGIDNSVTELDYPKAVTDFSAAQTAQQAAMSTLAKANRQNLFDFIG